MGYAINKKMNNCVCKNEVDELRKKRLVALNKRKHQQWFRIVLACFMTGVIVLLFTHFSNRVNASDLERQRTKYYTGIQIKEGDSLWSIAEEYVSEEYDSIQEYIEELKRVNQLDSNVIYSGRHLIVSYYK